MEFKDTVRNRRMVRNFTDDPVPSEAIERILDLARRGPSAGFTQGQDFVVVTDPDRQRAIADLCNEAAYHRRYQEPNKVDPDGTEIEWPVPYWFMDAGCAVMTVLLGAVDEGLAAAFAGTRDLNGLRSLLGIPPEVTPVGVIPIGHPAPDRRSPSLKRGRRDRRAVIHHETW